MNNLLLDKLGGFAIIVGSLLFAAYATLFATMLPIGSGDFLQSVLNPYWIPLALLAFVGILLMLGGFHAVYSRIRSNSGIWGALGFLFIQIAYLLQACKVTWELLLYPIIAAHPESAFLLRDAVIKTDPSVMAFRVAASVIIFIGVTLFCLALYRSNEYPKTAPLLIFAGAVTYAIGPLLSSLVAIGGIFVLAVGCLLLGIRLFKPAQAAR